MARKHREPVKSAMPASDTTVCLFCHEPIPDQGLGFYQHVQDNPACDFAWHDWMEEIPKDHGGA